VAPTDPPHGPDRAQEITAPTGLRIWCFSLAGAAPAQEWSLLDADETARARRFVFDRDRDRFVRAHAMVRQLLGGLLGHAPASLRFEAGPLGKPILRDTTPPLAFNLSHGGDLGALVVSREVEVEVGIDIEAWRPMPDALAVGASVFTAAETAGWPGADGGRIDREFLRLWTRKEAVLKALGLGLSLDPRQVTVGLQPSCCVVEVALGTQRRAVNLVSLEDHPLAAALAVAWL
jgi:4'-phosphopantetheinyl transferase